MRDEEPRVVAGGAAETLIADHAGLGEFIRGREVNADGGYAASKLGQWSWALFEAARDPNVIFQIYVISPFFATVMIADPIRGQELWGETVTYSGFITAVFAPFLGAIADKGGRRKPWLALWAGLMVISFAGTWFGVANSSATQIFTVAAMLVLNNIVFEFSNVFHAAMLSGVAPRERIGGLSGLAFALGSAAGVLLLIVFFLCFMLPGRVHAPFILSHPLFGVDQAAYEPQRLSGPLSALWMLLFAVPLFLWTPDRQTGYGWRKSVRLGTASVIATIRSLKHYRNVAHYLGARTLFNDGLTGVLTFTGIYAAGTFRLSGLEMAVFGIVICTFAALGGLVGGWLDDRFGSKTALLLSIGGCTLFFSLGLTMSPDRIFWFWHSPALARVVLSVPIFNTWPRFLYIILGSLMALCVVAGYANSRTMMARIAPHAKMTEFFGLMSLSGTAATFLAPVAVTLMTSWTHSQRGGLIAVAVLLASGFLWMIKVKEERATAI
ncbi:MAG TPA: MFS transporter [Rhizomicrobium sp.]|nr:MFS transporter [Rhizomicrobium sp.]